MLTFKVNYNKIAIILKEQYYIIKLLKKIREMKL